MNKQHTFFERYGTTKKAYLGSLLAILLTLACLGPTASPRIVKAAPQASNPIKHIVIMVKENRTFDSMFGTFPGAKGATTYTDPSGKVHPMNHQPDTLFGDIAHDHPSYLTAYDNGKMD